MRKRNVIYFILIIALLANLSIIIYADAQDSTAVVKGSAATTPGSKLPVKIFKFLKDWSLWGLFLGAVIWAYKKLAIDFLKKWQSQIDGLKKQLEKHEFYYKRERVYRELDLPFMHWHGVENCIVFSDKEKRYVKPIKDLNDDQYKEWLAPRDYLLLAIYREMCSGDHQQAISLLNETIEKVENDPEILASCYLQKARILREHEANNIRQILDLLDQAKQLDSHNISCLFYYAKINNEIQEYEIAAQTLEKLRELKHVDLFPININMALADVYTSMKKFDNALNLVESYLIFHPYHVKSIKSKANIYFHNKEISKDLVERYCNQILSINTGDDPELHYAVALLEYRLQQYDAAKKRLDMIINKRPRFMDYRLLLANIYFELGKEAELLETLKKIEMLDSETISKRKIKNVIEKIETLGLEEAKKKLRNIS